MRDFLILSHMHIPSVRRIHLTQPSSSFHPWAPGRFDSTYHAPSCQRYTPLLDFARGVWSKTAIVDSGIVKWTSFGSFEDLTRPHHLQLILSPIMHFSFKYRVMLLLHDRKRSHEYDEGGALASFSRPRHNQSKIEDNLILFRANIRTSRHLLSSSSIS